MHDDTGEAPDRRYFALFNEIGILAQLSRTLFERRMPDGLALPHFSVLNHLFRLGDGRTPLSMAKAFQQPKTSMTHTLAGLERRGLVTIKPNPEDGRSKLVYLTMAGRVMRERCIDSLGPDIAWLMEVYAQEDVDRVLPALERLRKLLDENRPA